MSSFNRIYKPNFGWMEPDKTYLLAEARLRFPVDAAFSLGVQSNPDSLLFYIGKDLKKGIENLERFKGWRVCDYVPSRKAFSDKKPCCDQMKQRAGTPLKIVMEPSAFQGDTDDAAVGAAEANPDRRIEVDGVVDWVAILHFWQPAIIMQTQGEQEERQAAYTAGDFKSWDQMPEEMWPVIRKRFEQNG